MNKRNELFKKALDWLYSEGKVADQRELSSATGINEVTISRIVNNKVNRSTEYSGNLFGSSGGLDVSINSEWESPKIGTW